MTLSAARLQKDGSRPEPCGVCQATFALCDLAEHTYACIKKLDPEERQQLEQLGDRKARELAEKEGMSAAAMGRSADQASLMQQFEMSKTPICRAGSACTRTDSNHFVELFHPPATCPLCNQEFAVRLMHSFSASSRVGSLVGFMCRCTRSART